MEETNKKQRDFWSGKGGYVWVEKQNAMDVMLEPLGNAALAKLPKNLGRHVIDIGCGCGSTTLSIAEQLNESAKITGVDISEPMLDQAKKVASEKNLSNVDFQVMDIQTELDIEGKYSAAFSRFGVMFFENPVIAFKNINRSLKEEANFSFVCWQSPKLNPWQSLSIQVIKQFVDLPSPPERSPGPFAFADADYLKSIMTDSGFKNINLESHEQQVTMFTGKSLEQASNDYLSINPVVTEMLKEAPESIKENISSSLQNLFKEYSNGNGLHFPSATWLVTARK
jgi:ubiquinone/menaquinone biosynthesis C-methylase UbiE